MKFHFRIELSGEIEAATAAAAERRVSDAYECALPLTGATIQVHEPHPPGGVFGVATDPKLERFYDLMIEKLGGDEPWKRDGDATGL